MSTDWQDSPYGREARERSMADARERIRETELEMTERRCRCVRPVPSRVYLGVPLCAWCQRLITRGES